MKRIVVLILSAAVISSLNAQEKRIPDGRRGVRDNLISGKVKLTEEQRQKARTLNDDYRKRMSELRRMEDITVKEWRSQMMDLNRKHRDEMRNLLTSEQRGQVEKLKLERKKMAEIDANAQLEKMKLRLDLSNEQMEKMKKQRTETIEKMKAIQENKSLDMLKKRQEIRVIMEKRKNNLKSILTEEQIKKMQELNRPVHKKRRVLS